jgi:hypothetical protein
MPSSQKSRSTLQDAASAVGEGKIQNCVDFSTQVFEVTGTFVGTVIFEALISSVWFTLHVKDINLNLHTSGITTTGVFRADISGFVKTRARISAYTSGNITVHSVISASPSLSNINQENLLFGADNGLPYSADSFIQSNPDAYGNYQTIVYKKGLDVVGTVTLTFDGNGNTLTFDDGNNYYIQSDPDAYGNYQTIVYKIGGAAGTVIYTVTLTFDSSGNVLTYSRA